MASALCLGLFFCFSGPSFAAQLNNKDRAEYETAFRAAERDRWNAAFRHARRATERLPFKALQWQYYRDRRNTAGFVEIAQFIRDNPNYPLLHILQRRAEERIDNQTPNNALLAFFRDNYPSTGNGLFHFVSALEKQGRVAEAKAALRQGWVSVDMNRRDERTLRKYYRHWMTQEDNRARLERLLWEGKTTAGSRQALLLPNDIRTLAKARIALRRQSGNVDRLIAQVPKQLRTDPGLIYERVRWRRSKRLYESAIDLLQQTRAAQSGHEKLWWRERGRLARWALEEGRITTAYRLAAQHTATDGYAHAEAEWFAGWVALRFLQEPERAYKHFSKMYDRVSYPISKARGAYWAGRALLAQNKQVEASSWFRIAAQFPTRFYGQMAANHLTYAERPRIPEEYRPTTAERKEFAQAELTRLIKMLEEANADDSVRSFIRFIAQTAENRATLTQLARLARDLGRPDLAVYTARKASQHHVFLTESGYPPLSQMRYRPLDPAIVMAVVRQESAFDLEARSHAGALGLMQLMPATAKGVARLSRVAYDKAKLTRDPEYNLHLGQQYLLGLLDRFDGSLPMTFAGYNAGPHRVKRWMRTYGDPRASLEDAIDWIEMIPFTETRNYVQRVMENVIVYQQRLQGRHVALTLDTMTGETIPFPKPPNRPDGS